MDYTTLTNQDKLDLARQRLWGLERDHFNTALLGDEASLAEQGLNNAREASIEKIKAEIAAIESKVAAAVPAD